ncbi:Thioesterase/thiol ester dehydrase-isomerase [Microthyrium microscopicum]|uniref:Thioesterase/thiol ester dehydrase-isomerase n=1 Tax=Microthyrium microscopicum TaxID=703497 RepID=A0A6A6U7V4_9PEZI|nr:Thioesterase/thiol ester dehydrase-isomerase [Microthyrium microscopicum]
MALKSSASRMVFGRQLQWANPRLSLTRHPQLLQQSRNSLQQRYMSTEQLPPPPPEPTNRFIRWAFTALGITLSFATGYTLANNTTIKTYVAVLTQPSDASTLSMFNPDADSQAAEIEARLQSHPLVRELQSDPKWRSSRPHLKMPADLRPHSFTAGHLLSKDKIPVPPLVFTTGDGMELVSIAWLGPDVCGHPGIVHGGLLATLMDEGLARTCFAALPNKVGVTAHLELDYRSPCKAGQFVVMRGQTTKVEGRKAYVKGRIETAPTDGAPGRTLVEGTALFVEPKGFAGRLMRIVS